MKDTWEINNYWAQEETKIKIKASERLSEKRAWKRALQEEARTSQIKAEKKGDHQLAHHEEASIIAKKERAQ
jgi:hypothetical protein